MLTTLDHPMKTYPAFDPGVTTGYAIFREDGEILKLGQLSFDELCRFLDLDDELLASPIKVICEDYKIFRKKAKAHIGSRVPTVAAIGVIRAYALKKKAEVILQPSNIMQTASLWTGIPHPDSMEHSGSHKYAAALHGSFYLIKEGILQTKLEKEHGTPKA